MLIQHRQQRLTRSLSRPPSGTSSASLSIGSVWRRPNDRHPPRLRGASALPLLSDGGAIEQRISPPQPFSSGRANCAQEIADGARKWIDEAMAAREGLTPLQRREKAFEHMDQAQDARLNPKAPMYMSVIGRHAWFARILIAED